jgi:hypothetical protein
MTTSAQVSEIAAPDATTTVGAVEPRRVTITEAGPATRLEQGAYDTATGDGPYSSPRSPS